MSTPYCRWHLWSGTISLQTNKLPLELSAMPVDWWKIPSVFVYLLHLAFPSVYSQYIAWLALISMLCHWTARRLGCTQSQESYTSQLQAYLPSASFWSFSATFRKLEVFVSIFYPDLTTVIWRMIHSTTSLALLHHYQMSESQNSINV